MAREARDPKCLVEGRRAIETASVLAGRRTAGKGTKPNPGLYYAMLKSVLH